MPSYTAHQVIVLPLMVYLVWQGIVEWFVHDESDGSTNLRHRKIASCEGATFRILLLVSCCGIFQLQQLHHNYVTGP